MYGTIYTIRSSNRRIAWWVGGRFFICAPLELLRPKTGGLFELARTRRSCCIQMWQQIDENGTPDSLNYVCTTPNNNISLDTIHPNGIYYIERSNKFHRCKTQRRNLIFGLFLSLQLSFFIEKLKWLFVGEGRFIRSGDTHDFWLEIWIKLNNIPLV